jgi:2-keto-4-pentenoate hydratase
MLKGHTMRIDELARHLDDARRQGREVERLTLQAPDLTLAQAYQVMDAGIALRTGRGERVVGLKMGLTSEAKRKQMDLDSPIYGVLTDRMVVEGTFRLAGSLHPKIEPEIAFRFDQGLRGRPDRGEVLALCSGVGPALEILDSRYRDFKYFSLPDVVADNASSSHLVLPARWVPPAGGTSRRWTGDGHRRRPSSAGPGVGHLRGSGPLGGAALRIAGRARPVPSAGERGAGRSCDCCRAAARRDGGPPRCWLAGVGRGEGGRMTHRRTVESLASGTLGTALLVAAFLVLLRSEVPQVAGDSGGGGPWSRCSPSSAAIALHLGRAVREGPSPRGGQTLALQAVVWALRDRPRRRRCLWSCGTRSALPLLDVGTLATAAVLGRWFPHRPSGTRR